MSPLYIGIEKVDLVDFDVIDRQNDGHELFIDFKECICSDKLLNVLFNNLDTLSVEYTSSPGSFTNSKNWRKVPNDREPVKDFVNSFTLYFSATYNVSGSIVFLTIQSFLSELPI